MVRNNVIDFVSISMSNSKSSMAKSMTDTDAMASMVTNVSNSKASMSSGKAANLGRGGCEESRGVDEDLEVEFLLEALFLSDVILRPSIENI